MRIVIPAQAGIQDRTWLLDTRFHGYDGVRCMRRVDKPKRAKQHARKWYLYIIKCCDGTLYTGITNDIERRIGQHNEGKASKYTRVRVPVRLIYKEACKNDSSALRKELRIKDLSRREKEEYISYRKNQLNREGARDARKP